MMTRRAVLQVVEVHPLKISSEEEDEEGGSPSINDVMLYRPKIAFNYQHDSLTSWDAPLDPFLFNRENQILQYYNEFCLRELKERRHV